MGEQVVKYLITSQNPKTIYKTTKKLIINLRKIKQLAVIIDFMLYVTRRVSFEAEVT